MGRLFFDLSNAKSKMAGWLDTKPVKTLNGILKTLKPMINAKTAVNKLIIHPPANNLRPISKLKLPAKDVPDFIPMTASKRISPICRKVTLTL